MDRTRAKMAAQQADAMSKIQVTPSRNVQDRLENVLIGALGHSGANAMLMEMESQAQSGLALSAPPWTGTARRPYQSGWYSSTAKVPRPGTRPTDKVMIEPAAPLTTRGGSKHLSELRRAEAIPFEDIERIKSLGPCVLASRLKMGPILNALSGRRKWSLRCKDEKLRKVTEEDLQRILLRYGYEFLSCMDYGVGFANLRWERRSVDQIGDIKGVGGRWWVVGKMEWAKPSTVQIIRDEKTFAFGGFVHNRTRMKPASVAIVPPAALVLTYAGQATFGGMWGRSMHDPGYDFAVWYERVMVAFLRWLDRDAQATAKVTGPGRGTSEMPDGTTMPNPEYGMILAESLRDNDSFWLPSDVDPNTSKPLWTAEYMSGDSVGTQFILALQYLAREYLRSCIVGDRAATQDSGETGSRSLGEVHARMTMIDDNFIFSQILAQLNEYLVIRYAQFNRSYNKPPSIVLEAEVLDPFEQEILARLMATAGNAKLGDGTPFDMVAWRRLFNGLYVPVLTDEEMEEQHKERMERKQENMEMIQQNQPAPAAQPGQGSTRQAGQNPPTQAQQNRAKMAEYIERGGVIPVTLNEKEMATAVAILEGKKER
jgi:hypothetical protein